MKAFCIHAAMLLALAADDARAQTSTATIAGVVRDVPGIAAAGAEVVVVNEQTGVGLVLYASADGRYTAAFLPTGKYTVRARLGTSRSVPQSATVQAGMSISIDVVLHPNDLAEVVNVRAPTRPKDDHHQITGWVERQQIDSLPLNGRNALETVKVEPGMTAPARASNGRAFAAPLGAGLNTIPRVGAPRVALDGGNIETPNTVGVVLQISPDVVEQVQVSTAGFNASVGGATSGAIDLITRSGGNFFTLGALALYRDRRWSAYPGIEDLAPAIAFPPLRRSQGSITTGGPLFARSFFFAGFERHAQRDLVGIFPADPELRALGGTFSSPYDGTLFNLRLDLQRSDRHRMFLRHTRDTNSSVAPNETTLPSAWTSRPTLVQQTMFSLRSILNTSTVNELRVSWISSQNTTSPVSARNCPSPCIGLGAPRINLTEGGPNLLTIGAAPFASTRNWRSAISESLVWQKGTHLIRLGFDWEHSESTVINNESDPVTMALWSPAAVRQRDPSISLPSELLTTEDLLRLPLRSFTTSVGGQVPWRGFDSTRRFDFIRGYASDQWSAGTRVSLNVGLAWAIEPGVLNDDLRKPSWLSSLVGPHRLDGPKPAAQFSGSLGGSWQASHDGRTVVRGGVGRYVDALARTVYLNLTTERAQLSPLGTGRLNVSGSNITWNGRRLNFTQPTPFTGADLLAILPAIRATLEQSLNPSNRDFSVVNLDQTKEGRSLYDPAYTNPRAMHATVGIAQELEGGIFVSVDAVLKRFRHTFINGIDFNRFFSAKGPIIPACTAAQRDDVRAHCSNGSLFFDTTKGRGRYLGALARVEKRFANRTRLLVSYAYGSFIANNGTGTGTTETSDGRVFGFNNDNWSENYGPVPSDLRHVLNVSGLVVAPGRIEVSFNLAAYGRAPFSPYIAGMDFNGDGTSNDLLPGTRVNQFNRGLGKGDLVRLVADYNRDYAGKLSAGGLVAPVVVLPDTFEFGDNFFALDLRLARSIQRNGIRLSAFVDIFNVFNTMNLTGYGSNLLAPAAFGRPTARVGQAFGSGGPRAMQLGLRMGF